MFKKYLNLKKYKSQKNYSYIIFLYQIVYKLLSYFLILDRNVLEKI